MAADEIAPVEIQREPRFWSLEAWRIKPPRPVRVGCIGASFTILAVPLTFLALAITFGWFRNDAPNLPSWAYPVGDVLHRYDGCGGNGDDLPPCRTIQVGASATMRDVIAELQPEFTNRGWQTRIGPTGESLWAQSPSSDICVGYYAFYREQAVANAQRYLGSASNLDPKWRKYSAEIRVLVDDCSSKG